MENLSQDLYKIEPGKIKAEKAKKLLKEESHPDVEDRRASKPPTLITEKHTESRRDEHHPQRTDAEIESSIPAKKQQKTNSIQGMQHFDDSDEEHGQSPRNHKENVPQALENFIGNLTKDYDVNDYKEKHDSRHNDPLDSSRQLDNILQKKESIIKKLTNKEREEETYENPDYVENEYRESFDQSRNKPHERSIKEKSLEKQLSKKSSLREETSIKKNTFKKSDSDYEEDENREFNSKKSLKESTVKDLIGLPGNIAEELISDMFVNNSPKRSSESIDSENKTKPKVIKQDSSFKETFSTNPKALNDSKKLKQPEKSKEAKINQRRNSRSSSSSGSKKKSERSNDSKKNNLDNKDQRGTPETPNLGSPVKNPKSSKDPHGSAYWSRDETELQKLKTQEKLKEYENIIKKQAEEIKELKRIIASQQLDKPKRQTSPRSSGYMQKKIEGTFLKKEPELFRKEDLDFWKITDDSQNNREPQKLEEISALKDLWILNMESGSSLGNNVSKKSAGVKPNPLTKYEPGRHGNTKARILPKISTKKDLRK